MLVIFFKHLMNITSSLRQYCYNGGYFSLVFRFHLNHHFHLVRSPYSLFFTTSIHTTSRISKKPNPDEIITPICDLLRKGENWDGLSKRFDSIQLTNPTIEKVLLDLKEPIDAKRALTFFHWSARRTKHGVLSYCIIVHILVRARLLIDARALLESIIKRDSESSSSVAELLLATYQTTSSVPLVFDLLIQTYSKLRMFDAAFDACRFLGENGYYCSVISFNTLIHVIQKSSGKCELVWKVYEHMIHRRTYPNDITIRIMIDVLCKQGKLQRYIDVLDRIHGKRCSPAVIVNSALVIGVIEEGRVDDGIVLVKRMLQKNFLFDDVAYSLIIFAKFKTNSNLGSAHVLFGEMVEMGFRANAFLYTLFIGAHCKEARIDEAKQLMQEMKAAGLKPYDEIFNVLIEGCSDAGRTEESLNFCEEMVKGGFLPSCSAFNNMIKNINEIGEVRRANDMLTILLDEGFRPNEVTYTYLMDGYGKEGEIEEVVKLFYEMEYKGHSPDLMTYTSLVRSLCRCRRLEEAKKYLLIMKDRSIAPTVEIHESLAIAYYENGNTTLALEIYKQMIIKGLKPKCENFMQWVERVKDAG